MFDFLKVAQPGLRYDVIALSDLRPFIYECTQYTRDLMKMDTQVPARAGLMKFSWELACAFAGAIGGKAAKTMHGWIAAWQMMRIRRNPAAAAARAPLGADGSGRLSGQHHPQSVRGAARRACGHWRSPAVGEIGRACSGGRQAVASDRPC